MSPGPSASFATMYPAFIEDNEPPHPVAFTAISPSVTYAGAATVKPRERADLELASSEHSDHISYDVAALLQLLPLALVSSDFALHGHLHDLAEQLRVTLSADAVLIQILDPDAPVLTLKGYAFSDASRPLARA